MARPHPRQRLAKALLIEGLQQIVHCADLECLQRIGVVGCDEYQRRQLLRRQRAREIDAVQRVHVDVEEQQMRRLRSNGGKRVGAVAEFAHHAQIVFRLAVFAQGASARNLIVHDDDIHHVPSRVLVCNLPPACGSRTTAGDSRTAGMLISLIHSLSTPAADRLARPSNCTAMRSRTFLRPMPSAPMERFAAIEFVTRMMSASFTMPIAMRTVTAP